MSVSESTITSHINLWSQRLARTSSPFRAVWPKYLFRHETLDNAARILNDGVLLSRKDAQSIGGFRDIAARRIITLSDKAHDKVRLYFRPRNPTLYHVEGCKRRHEQRYPESHAPTIVFFIFDTHSIFSIPNVQFSDGNMQSSYSSIYSSDSEFKSLDFARIYSDGTIYPQDHEMRRARCAEVLIRSPLKLQDHLQAIICRSSADRESLQYLMGDSAQYWRNYMKISAKPGAFFHRWAYLKSLSLTADKIVFHFHPHAIDPCKLKYGLKIVDVQNQNILINQQDRELVDPSAKHSWVIKRHFGSSIFDVELELENYPVYRNRIDTCDIPF